MTNLFNLKLPVIFFFLFYNIIASAANIRNPGKQFDPFIWPHEPPADNPFPRSQLFTKIEFTGVYAAYGGADTWYPTWAADGNLYSPWTDGGVRDALTGNQTDAGSWCHVKSPKCKSTTGSAMIVGDDPLNLTLTSVHNFASSTLPYHGRYPCGSLVYNNTWFYGTYSLDNENHQPGEDAMVLEKDSRKHRRLKAGYCGNWCIQGPFVGFRYSIDKGKTWTEPRWEMESYRDNIFQEEAPNNVTKVKFGAPHVVDFGQEMQYSPDQKLYMVGHGASQSHQPTSWIQGSEIYITRVKPTVVDTQRLSSWEFWNANTHTWVAGDVRQAKPIIHWENRTGVTTMTYVPAIQRFITIVSTPTFSPFTRLQFDTYILESEEMTGPFRMITYMKEFGKQSYFVNIPSKFMSTSVDEQDGSLSLFLSYSANFAFHDDEPPNPPGSAYHWTLQKIKLKP